MPSSVWVKLLTVDLPLTAFSVELLRVERRLMPGIATSERKSRKVRHRRSHVSEIRPLYQIA